MSKIIDRKNLAKELEHVTEIVFQFKDREQVYKKYSTYTAIVEYLLGIVEYLLDEGYESMLDFYSHSIVWMKAIIKDKVK